jgi:hypothetical protein
MPVALDWWLITFSRPMAATAFRAAIAGFGQFAIWTNTGLSVNAPEQAIIAGRYRRIRVGENELAFPAQGRTEVRMMGVEAI